MTMFILIKIMMKAFKMLYEYCVMLIKGFIVEALKYLYIIYIVYIVMFTLTYLWVY